MKFSKIAFALFVCLVGALHSDEKQTLLFGMSTALSGPAAELGINMKRGVEVAFQSENNPESQSNFNYKLLALDDAYEPEKTVPNMNQLMIQHRVLGIIGNVGTPTAVAAIPLAIQNKTLFYGAYTGSSVLRKEPPDRNVFNYRASYSEETEAIVDALLSHGQVALDEIAFFTQRDAYGDSGFSGGITALRKHGLKNENQVVHGRYERNTLAVELGLADIMESPKPAKAIIMVGTYKPCAKFIRMAKQYQIKAVYINVSFVGTQALLNTLKGSEEGVLITQVVPHLSAKIPMVEEYHKAMQKYSPGELEDYGSLEGYVATKLLIEATKKCKRPVNRENLIESLENLGPVDIGLGLPLLIDKNNHQASHQVWATVLRNGKVEPFEWKDIRQLLP